MHNLALKCPIEEQIQNASLATDGNVTNYDGNEGYSHFPWPGTLTVDLGHEYSVKVIRFLLWDNLGIMGGFRDPRRYRYRLLTSSDHKVWNVIHDTGLDGYNGWQVFYLGPSLLSRYIRIHGIWNSANILFHVVQIETYENEPPPPNGDIILQRTIRTSDITHEIRDGLPLQRSVTQIINRFEALISEYSEYVKPEIFQSLIQQLRLQVSDIAAIESSLESIRREFLLPVESELRKGARLGRFSVYSFWVGLVGGVVAVIALATTIDWGALFLKIDMWLNEMIH